jgi:predicted amidophosphoribosyltransferase
MARDGKDEIFGLDRVSEVESSVNISLVDTPHYACYTCGNDSEGSGKFCPHCGSSKADAEQAFAILAEHIDDVYLHLDEETRDSYHHLMKRMRLVNPEFREMWYNLTTAAAYRRAQHG